MKKIFLTVILFGGLVQQALCFMDYSYEVTKSTFNFSVVTIGTTTPALVSLSPEQTVKASGASYTMYSLSLINVSTLTAVYALHNSTSSAPALTCANGPVLGGGTATAPLTVTEKFEGLYMWVMSCALGDISLRRVIRGR
jgi:hypothetical protein